MLGWMSKILLSSSNYIFLVLVLFSMLAQWKLQVAMNVNLRSDFPLLSHFTNTRCSTEKDSVDSLYWKWSFYFKTILKSQD